MAKRQFIVAEVSKGWRDGAAYPGSTLLSEQFEEVIAVNFKRGYRLHTWKLVAVAGLDADGVTQMTETIVAVFQTAP